MKSNLWKLILCSLLLLGSACTLLACSPSGKDDPTPPVDEEVPPQRLYDTVLEEVILSSGEDRLAVNFCREDVVHFRYAPAGTDFAPEGAVPESIAKYDRDYAPVYGEIEQTDDATILRTEGVIVTVDKTSLAFSITDAAGNLVFQSAAQAFSVSGEGKKVSFVRDVMGTQEHFYGLGNDRGSDFTTTDHRGTIYDLWLHDDNVHAIIPLWYSTSGYGIYLNNSNRGSISFKEDYSLSVEGGEMNFYFFYGPSFKTILTNWSELAGRMSMPPLYALGLTYRGFGQWTEEQLLEALTSQLNAGIAIDVAGVEPGWQTKTYPCTYAWASKFTDDATSFVQTLHALGLHVNLWEHPYVSPSATIATEIAQYSLQGSQVGTREWEGNGGTYAFGGLIPDMTIEEARELYWQIHDENLGSIGVDGYKIDETDSWGASNSLELLFPGGISNNAYHNLLGTLTVNLMHEKYRDEYNMRTFIFSRGNYAGMQRFATTAYTDYYGFDQFVMSVIAQSYSGTYYTPEIRDVSTPSDVDYMRRTQLMFLTPFAMSNEWASEATVLGRSKAVIECYKEYNALHYQLIPYMYSLFWEQHNTGVGVTRSLILEFQNDTKTYDIDDQFMLGDALLVCPVSSSARLATEEIYLPAGELWMDYNTGYVYEGGQTIEYTCSASTLPLFVRMGSIIPLGHYGDNTADVIDTTLTLDIFPNEENSTFTLYEDDGITYDYSSQQKYALTTISAQLKDGTIVCTLGERSGKYTVAKRDCVMQLHYRATPESVTLDGKALKAVNSLDEFNSAKNACYYYNASAANDFDKVIYVRLTDDGKEHTVQVKVGEQSAQQKPAIVMEGTLYECEDSRNTLVGARVVTGKSYASGKALVGNVGNNGQNTLTMKGITVSEDGQYEIEIIYINGESAPRMLYVSANGGEAIPIWCYSSGSWETPASIMVTLPFKKGENTLTFGTAAGKGWAPDLDHIIVYDDEPVVRALVGEQLSPDDAQIVGKLQISANSGAIGGEAASGFGGLEETALLYTVQVKSSGPYQLNINYSNYSNAAQNMELTINGESSEISLPSTQSTHLFATLNMTVYLKAGENTIQIGSKGGATLYECEVGGEYTNCNNKLAPRDGYEQSGGYAVGATQNNGAASFTMKGITVPEDGTYRVLIYIGSGDTRTFRLKVNGEDTGKLYSFQSGHFHNFKPLELELELEEGENTLTIWQDDPSQGDSAWLPNFDYVILPDTAQESPVCIGAISIQ